MSVGLDTPSEMQQIIEICDSRVKYGALRGPYGMDDGARTNKSFASLTLCVDGTSATRKSTVLGLTGLEVRKVQRFATSRNTDTYFPSMIGYIASGINQQSTGELRKPKLNDRSYLNVLEWNLLWRMMDDYVQRMGNTDPWVTDGGPKLMNEYRTAFKNLAASYHYRYLRQKFRSIAFIDSDVRRCDMIRMRRNEGNDRERSSWLFYTPMQNLMYETLYPMAHVDLAWFSHIELGDDDRDLVVSALSVWVRRLAYCALNRQELSDAYVPHRSFKLPSTIDPTKDYCLRNIEVHTYRAFGRMVAKRAFLEAQEDATMRDINDWPDNYVESSTQGINNTVPSYVGIARIPEALGGGSRDGAILDIRTIVQERAAKSSDNNNININNNNNDNDDDCITPDEDDDCRENSLFVPFDDVSMFEQ